MPVTNYYFIGNLTVPSSWIALIIAFVIAYGAIRLRFGKMNAEVLSDAFFYLIIVWKLSIIILDFDSIIHSPLSIFYFHGGTVGYYLGLAFVGGKILWDRKRDRIGTDGILALLTGAVIVQTVYQLAMVVLNEGKWVVQLTTSVVFLAILVFFWMNSVKSVNWQIQLIVLFTAVHIFVASVQPGGLLRTSLISTLLFSSYFTMLLLNENRNDSGTEEQL